MPSRDRFVTLDGMRGFAAMVVAASHLLEMLGLGFPPHADLAVDFFFVLSGFVIAHAYEERLRASMTPLDFIAVRVIRLHPLIILGSGITLVMLLMKSIARGGEGLLAIIWAAIAGILFIPYHQLPWDAAYPLDGPAWSLFAEYAVNILFAFIALFLTMERLRRVLIAGVAMLIILLALNGTVGDVWQADRISLSLLRVVYPFFAGVLVSRIYRSGQLRLPKLPPWLPICGLLAILLAPSTGLDVLFEFVMIVVGFPLLVAASARDSLGPAATRLMLLGGALSYPIYVLHFPIGAAVAPLALLLLPAGWAAAAAAITMACILAASWLALRHFDEPLRAWLSASFRSRRLRQLTA